MFPRGALIYLTDLCNLNCRHCGIVNKDGSYITDEDFYNVIDMLKRKKCYIVAISGGDPILHSKLFKYLHIIRENGMLPVLGISGIKLNRDLIQKIKISRVGCVQVSLDGSNEVQNSIIRDENSFDEIVKNVKIMNSIGIKVNIAACICSENQEYVVEMLDFFSSINAYKVKIQLWRNVRGISELNELSIDEKKEVLYTLERYIDTRKKHDWIYIDEAFYGKDETEKFIVLPNGNVLVKDAGKTIGHITRNYKEIEKYYE